MKISIALNRYDRHVPFFNGTVPLPKGLEIEPLEVGESMINRDGTDRHERGLNHVEFDVVEMSLSSFIMAVARDPNLPLVGIPIFPRRFFSAGQMYVGAKSGIETPADLVGKRIGVHAFQVTLSVLAKGDLALDYGFDWRKSRWVCMKKEVVPVDLGSDVDVSLMPAGKDMGMMLCEGEIDALFSPQPRKSMLQRPDQYRRLFADVRAEEVRYFGKHGYYPIMHLMAVKRELIEKRPELGRELIAMFDAAKALAYSYYDDSNYSLLVDSRKYLEDERKDFGLDPWPNGFKANALNLDRFIGYSHDQRLIPERFPASRLFHASTLDT
jgi:4,5-dihydroxyphthalate decarboxylase